MSKGLIFKLCGRGFMVVGFVCLGVTGWSANRQYSIVKSWPAVDAEVTKSQVKRSLVKVPRRLTPEVWYRPEIEFRYKVNGGEYVSPYPDQGSNTEWIAKQKVQTYAPGTRHSIRYNSADPTDIRVDVGYNFEFFLIPLVFGACFLFCTGLGLGFLKASKSALGAEKCPTCGCLIQRVQRYHFCSNCAEPLVKEAKELTKDELLCPFCNDPVPKGQSRCTTCAKALPRFGVYSEKGKMRCNWCGEQVMRGQNFCHSCSAPLANEVRPA